MRSSQVCVVSLLAFAAACGGGAGYGNGVEVACQDGFDEDEDTLTDCDDPDCADDVACQGMTFDATDPEDLPGPDGDPSLDLEGVNVTVSGTTATFQVHVHGNWPPDTSFYSWFVKCSLLANNSVILDATTQRHDGQDSTFQVPASATATVSSGAGVVTIVIDNVPGTPTQFNVQSGIQKTTDGTRVVDEIAGGPLPIP